MTAQDTLNARHAIRSEGPLVALARLVRAVKAYPRLAIGCAGVALFVIAAVAAPVIVPRSPLDQDLTQVTAAPSLAHPFGTDALGREEISRVIYGARTSLTVAGVGTLVSIVIGTTIGLVAGWYGGIMDDILMWLFEVFVSFPFILLAIVIVGWLGASTSHTIIAMTVTGWVTLARVVRGQVLSLRTATFVEAAHSVGCSDFRILVRHITPQLVSIITVIGTLEISRMMLLEGSLSFLGLGVPLPTPSWGNMLADGRSYMTTAWWLTVIPGAALLVTVLLINQVGDGLRDVFDPSLRGR